MIKKLAQDKFFRSSLIYFAGSMLANFFSYLFHPVIGRLVGIAEFGEIQTLVSITLQFNVIFMVFTLIAANIVANNENKTDAASILFNLQKISFYGTFFISLLFLIMLKPLQSFLNFSSPLPIAAVSIFLIISIFYTFRTAWFQGRHDFVGLSVSSVINAICKLGFAIILVSTAYKVLGGIFALILAQLASLLYALYRTRNDLKTNSSIQLKHTFSAIINKWHYGLIIFAGSGVITFFYTFDIVTIKHYFSAEEAGYYSGIAIIARIIFFATFPIASVLFPSIKLKNPPELNKKYLIKTFIAFSAIAWPILLIFAFFPQLIMNLLLGNKYLAAAYLLPLLSWHIFFTSLANIFIYYFMALRKTATIYFSLMGFIIVLILLLINHQTETAVIYDFMAGGITLNLIMIIYYLFSRRKMI